MRTVYEYQSYLYRLVDASHVAGTHPNAHKIHFPSPPITLADVLTLIHHHLL